MIVVIIIITIIITIIIFAANEFMDLVQHLPGYAAPIVDDNDIHTKRKVSNAGEDMLHRSVAHHHHHNNSNSNSNSKQEDEYENKNDDGDEDPCKDDVCVVEYPTPINCEHSNDYYDKSDGSSSRRDDDVHDCRIKLEQDNLTYSGKISEGMENTACINSAVALHLLKTENSVILLTYHHVINSYTLHHHHHHLLYYASSSSIYTMHHHHHHHHIYLYRH
jgi:hypothetical protein